MSDLIKKLQIKSGQKGQIINQPPGLELAEQIPAEVLSEETEGLDWVLVFVNNQTEVNLLGPQAADMIVEDGLLWFCYPKKSSKIKTDINRDAGWEALDKLNLRPIRAISLNDVWSALRFRDKDRVK